MRWMMCLALAALLLAPAAAWAEDGEDMGCRAKCQELQDEGLLQGQDMDACVDKCKELQAANSGLGVKCYFKIFAHCGQMTLDPYAWANIVKCIVKPSSCDADGMKAVCGQGYHCFKAMCQCAKADDCSKDAYVGACRDYE